MWVASAHPIGVASNKYELKTEYKIERKYYSLKTILKVTLDCHHITDRMFYFVWFGSNLWYKIQA